MRETMDPIPPGAAAEKESFANRKLIRPTLPRPENHGSHNSSQLQGNERHERPERHDRMQRNERSDRGDRGMNSRKSVPAEQTNAENFYYQKQMQSRTPMVIVLRDGEEICGTIEWYDRNCVKINR